MTRFESPRGTATLTSSGDYASQVLEPAPYAPMTVEKARRAFIEWARMARGLAQSSAKSYETVLKRFEQVAGPNRTLDRAAPFVEKLLIDMSKRGVGDHYRRHMFQILRHLYRWAAERGHARGNPLRDYRTPIVHDKPRSFLSRAQVEHLLATVYRSERMHARRDHAIIATMFYAGLRIGEVLRLRLREVDLERRELAVLGKGSKVRRVPIHPELARIIKRWSAERPQDTDLLFPSRARHWSTSGQLDNVRIEKMIRTVYAPAAGLAGRVTPHTLRRSFATELRRKDVPLEHVQHLLGHSQITTTMEYLAEPVEGLKASVDRL